MVKGAVMCIFIFMSLSVISAAEALENSQENQKRTETDLVSNLFSELGNLFLDIDETLAIQTAPKIEFEGLVAQLLRPSNEHFSNVQENYRTLQKRLGSFIRQSSTSKSTYTDLDLSTIGSQKREEKSKQDFSARVPLSKVDPFKLMGAEIEGNWQSTVPLDAISDGECSVDILSNPLLEPEKRMACSQRFKRNVHDKRLKRPMGRKEIESRRKNQLHVPFDADELYTYPYGFFRRGGDVAESTPKPQGRILGDMLYSESSFDRNLRQLLKDHGRWLLDNPFLTRWRKAISKDNSDMTSEASSTVAEVSTESSSDTATEMESTQAYIPITHEYNTEIPVSRETLPENLLPLGSANYYRLINTDGNVGEEVEVVLNPNLNLETVQIVESNGEFKKPSPEGSVILAFTQDGIPLKLRMGPEIENPSRFLHKVLKSAGVNLNVPVESLDDIKPVGNEVLKFGAGVLTRPTYYDLSNRDDLKTLLMTLKLKHRENLNTSS